MTETKDELLYEFENLIDTIGTEVASRISAQVATETTNALIHDQVMQRLQTLIASSNELLNAMPQASRELNTLLTSTRDTEQRMKSDLQSITTIGHQASAILAQTKTASQAAKATLTPALEQLQTDFSGFAQETALTEQKIKSHVLRLEKKFNDINERLDHQQATLEQITAQLTWLTRERQS